jgi:hypothetical protein
MTGIKEDVEKRFYEFLSDIGDRVGAERVQHFVEGAITGAVRTKKVVDKNVESFLSLANIPSRRDYDRMRAKVDALQGSVMNLSRAVENLHDQLTGRNGHATPKAATHFAPKAKATPKKVARASAPKRSGRGRSSRAR